MIQKIYNRLVRPILPAKIGVLNGVPVRFPKLLDFSDVDQDYEAELIAGIRTVVRNGDEVTIVGGGWGVSAVVAARRNLGNGVVTVFEGGRDQLARIRETLRLNRLEEVVDVKHAIVGPNKHVYGEIGSAKRIKPSDIPSSDVLILDCEGSELDILNNLDRAPRSVVVEVHPMYGVEIAEIRDLLDTLGYDILNESTSDVSIGEIGFFVAEQR